VLALGFLSGRVTSLFSKTGNSVEIATIASGGGSSGGGDPGGGDPGGGDPGGGLPTTVTPVSSGVVWSPGTSVHNAGGSDENNGYSGQAGVYSVDSPGHGAHTGGSCNFVIGGVSYTGYWVYHNDIPGPNSDWVIGNKQYDWACLALAGNQKPANGSVGIAPAGPVHAGTQLTATASGYTGATWYVWDWDRNDRVNDPNCAGQYGGYSGDPDGGTASSTSKYAPPGGHCYLVRVRAQNAFGDASLDTSNVVQVN
jgi:hypothetical protein